MNAMGARNRNFAILTVIFVVGCARTMDNLRVAFRWKQLDYNFPSDESRKLAILNREFVPENNLPLGLEVYGDRLFITVPRWKTGVAASLAYIKLNDSMDSPKLNPYPNWEAHTLSQTPPEIVSPFRIRADQCGRLWVLDTGIADLLGDTKVFYSSELLVYDLHNDALLRRYKIPASQIKQNTFFANIAVEDHNCEDTYAYLGDLGGPSIVVYSWKDNRSWQVNHHYFHIDPLAGEMSVAGINFQWTDGVFGLALSASDEEGYSTLYFHPMTSTNEFAVSTKILRNETLAKDSFSEFKILGNRGPKSQSGPSFLDKKTGVLFYTLLNLNAIACWKTTNPSYTMQSQGRIYMSNVTMVFPNDIKVDGKGNIWALSDKLPIFMYSKLDEHDYNFRILTASVKDAIRGTACDSKLVIKNDLSNRFNTQDTNSVEEQKSDVSCVRNSVSLFVFILFSRFF